MRTFLLASRLPPLLPLLLLLLAAQRSLLSRRRLQPSHHVHLVTMVACQEGVPRLRLRQPF